jgi:polar amino acid transport system substrate-binding protein
MTRRAAALGIALLTLSATAALAQPKPGDLPEKVWRVGIFESPPYTMRGTDGQWRGLNVELWKELASELNLQYRLGEASPDTILDDVAHDRLDIAIAPFSPTVEREQLVDFTQAYVMVELGIAVRRTDDEQRWLTIARALSTSTALKLYAVITILVFVAGTILWLLERRRNPQFSGDALQGVGSGFWWSGVTTVAVGYGDKVPITFWGRMIALLWMFVSLILVTAFTAFVTAKLAVAEFGSVRGPDNLHNTVVGTIEGATASDTLRRLRIRHRVYPNVPAALTALSKAEIGAVVYGSSTLDYYVSGDTARRLEVLPQAFDRQFLAFPVPDRSMLRGPVNDAMRRYLQQPGWRDLQDQYLVAERLAPGDAH